MILSQKPITGLLATVLLTSASVTFAAGQLNVSNWAEYMAEDTIENFAKEYDIEVTFTPYDSVEAIDSKLLAGNSGYDVVSHAASQAARLIPGGILQKIDKSKLDNLKHFLIQNAVPILFIMVSAFAIPISQFSGTYLIQEMLVRLSRNSFLVLSLLIPIMAGMGLNFGMVLGAMAG